MQTLPASHLASKVAWSHFALVGEICPQAPLNDFCKIGYAPAELSSPAACQRIAALCEYVIGTFSVSGYTRNRKGGDAALKIIGERLRGLRESVRLSQVKLAKEFDVSQSALARYEIDDSTPSPEVFLKYADYFDVSLDYIFGRTDDPHGMIYNNCVKLGLNNPEMARFVEMCFDPGASQSRGRLSADHQTVLRLLRGLSLRRERHKPHGKGASLLQVRFCQKEAYGVPQEARQERMDRGFGGR
mgnify:CR=1 FL=1